MPPFSAFLCSICAEFFCIKPATPPKFGFRLLAHDRGFLPAIGPARERHGRSTSPQVPLHEQPRPDPRSQPPGPIDPRWTRGAKASCPLVDSPPSQVVFVFVFDLCVFPLFIHLLCRWAGQEGRKASCPFHATRGAKSAFRSVFVSIALFHEID